MSWNLETLKRFGKRPIWLYQFERDIGGATQTDRITSRLLGGDYTDGGSNLWTKKNLAHTRIRMTSVQDRAEVRVVFPRTDPLALDYRNDLTVTTGNMLRIYHEYIGGVASPASPSPDPLTYPFRRLRWIGRVVGTESDLLTITLICEPGFTSLRGSATGAVLQRQCRHAIYVGTSEGYGCGAVLANFQSDEFAVSVDSSTGYVITVPGASANPDGYYLGGVFEWNGIRETIADHVGQEIQLTRRIPGLEAALMAGSPGFAEVKLAPGCPGTRQICNDRFGQLPRHGGWPWAKSFLGDGRALF